MVIFKRILLVAGIFRTCSGITCYYCENGKYDADCLANAIQCPSPNQICMTELRQENGQLKISKGCKQKHACDQHAKYDYGTCTDNPMSRVCYQCCDEDFCNDNMYLPPLYEGSNQCGVTNIQPFLNFNSVDYADEMWANLRKKKRRRRRSALAHSSSAMSRRARATLTDSEINESEPTFSSENPPSNIQSVNAITSPLVYNTVPKITLKLAGGQDSIPGSWAWVAQIKRKVKPSLEQIYREIDVENEFICAGTLIHVRWILTAAQCIHQHKEPFDFYDTDDIYVVVGSHKLYGNVYETPTHQEVDVKSLHEHKNYRIETTPRNDIALLELSRSVVLSAHVQPACLPSGRYPNEFNTIAEPRADDWCWFVGWGFNKALPAATQSRPDDLARTLQQARQYPLHAVLCEGLLAEWNPDMSQHLCAVGGEELPLFGHPCEGDGGGPLICQRKRNRASNPGQPENMWFIAGVEIGQSAFCGYGDWKKIPAIFSRVTVFENWINSVIEGKYNLTKVSEA